MALSIPSVCTFDGSVNFLSRPVLRARTGGWRACIFIIGFEFTERLAYYGIKANLVLYIKTELHQGSASATESVNNWIGATTLLPIFAILLADAYLGRFWTVVYSSSFHILGLIMLTLSACLTSLRPGTCFESFSCPTATVFQLAFFYLSLYLIVVGTAGVKPCIEALGADQFDEYHPVKIIVKAHFSVGCTLELLLVLL
ncbi:hypothetical protein L7F22_032556 [Adiantum nelumboides]|nr:hypothetical protein [Adiantum nelumboides]